MNHDHSIVRDRVSPPSFAGRGRQLAAACAGLTIAVLLWTVGARFHTGNPHRGDASRTTLLKLWDKHQDLTRPVAAMRPSPSRRPPNRPTSVAAQQATVRLTSAGYRVAEERRPVTLAPHLGQIRLRAPPTVLA
ncbi:MAG TPA: hypothetical protein VGL22_11185 [Terracidiphilus sp.]